MNIIYNFVFCFYVQLNRLFTELTIWRVYVYDSPVYTFSTELVKNVGLLFFRTFEPKEKIRQLSFYLRSIPDWAYLFTELSYAFLEQFIKGNCFQLCVFTKQFDFRFSFQKCVNLFIFVINKVLTHNNTMINSQFLFSRNEISISKSPDRLREKLPLYKPKKLDEIFSENKSKQNCSSPQNEYPVKITPNANNKLNKGIIEQKKAKESLEDLIRDCGHELQVQSQYQSSQFDQDVKNSQASTFNFSESNKQKKKQHSALTPQYNSRFSMMKTPNQFQICKDDNSILNNGQKAKSKFWDGKINLTASVCQDQLQDLLSNSTGIISSQLTAFMNSNFFYAQCVNTKNKNQYLFQSDSQFEFKQIHQKLLIIQKTHLCKSDKNKQFNIKFASMADNSQVLDASQSYKPIQEQFNQFIQPKTRFIRLTYCLQPRHLNQ